MSNHVEFGLFEHCEREAAVAGSSDSVSRDQRLWERYISAEAHACSYFKKNVSCVSRQVKKKKAYSGKSDPILMLFVVGMGLSRW